MIIIASCDLVRARDRNTYVDAFCDLVSRAREFDGCVHIAITADSVDPERINSVEVWRDAKALDEWRRQAKAPLGKAQVLGREAVRRHRRWARLLA
jgi:quinol monooxygenase YgiN